MIWVTDIVNKQNKTYSSNKEALEEVKKTIARWGKHNNMNIYLYNNAHDANGKKCNRIISIISPPWNKAYEYKLTIHNSGHGYIARLKRLYSSGFSYSKKEYINVAFRFYEDDPL